MKEGREIKNNKKYGYLLAIAVGVWGLVGLMIWGVDPDLMRDFIIPGFYLPMAVALATALFLLYAILLLSTKKALRWMVATMIFVYLRIWGLGSWLNGLLILGVMMCIEVFLKERKNKN